MFRSFTKESYGDEHRLFVQGIMSRCVLNSNEVFDLFKKSCIAAGGEKLFVVGQVLVFLLAPRFCLPARHGLKAQA